MNYIDNQLPNLEDLLKLEKIAREKGSGVEFNSFIGSWRFNTVWSKGSNKKDSISSTLLQIFFAKLELKPESGDKNFIIINSLKFGLISLCFKGKAYIERNQPLITFQFDKLEVEIGYLKILNKKIEPDKNKAKPFFAIIGIDENHRWLSARGKGGGIALWTKE
tara:strand:- start:2460 stop:2951 length:492 start_codon:yes stop_codon:yes gene_type:complete